ncbi:MAG: segregation/condensation protein A [Candidatus Aureabacteria bacterium]|nr:segregation/condensation protein A [Candidatus Auribacterota bacterium]
MPEEYKFKLKIFEGPLDLLLYLIKKDEIDIHDIPIESITRQYLEYMNALQMLNIDLAAEFISLAATLLYIKSKMLIPSDQRNQLDDEEPEDPRWDLVQKLLTYKQFKEAAEHFEDLHEKQRDSFSRGYKEADSLFENEPANKIKDWNIFDLCLFFKQALKKAFEKQDSGAIMPDEFTVEQKIAEIRLRLLSQKRIRFSEMLGEEKTKNEIICIFLAMLELIKEHEIFVQQEGPLFSEIHICQCEEKPFAGKMS